MDRDSFKPGLQFVEPLAIDSHRGVQPAAMTAAAAADGVAHEVQWMFADITNLFCLRCKEWMFTVRRKDGVEPVEPQVLHFRLPRRFAPSSRPLGHRDAVLEDDFLISFSRLFPARNSACNVEIVAVRHIADGQLLNEAATKVSLSCRNRPNTASAILPSTSTCRSREKV